MDQTKAAACASRGNFRCATRRNALKFAACAGVGVAIATMAGNAHSQPAKLPKDAVKYTDAGNVAGKDCDDCSQYVAGRAAGESASCKIVEGPINPHGHCIAFSPKPK